MAGDVLDNDCDGNIDEEVLNNLGEFGLQNTESLLSMNNIEICLTTA